MKKISWPNESFCQVRTAKQSLSTNPACTPLRCVKRWYSASQSFCSVGNVDLYSRCAPPSKHHLNSHYTQGREYAHFPPKLSEGFLEFFVPVYARYTPFFPIPPVTPYFALENVWDILYIYLWETPYFSATPLKNNRSGSMLCALAHPRAAPPGLLPHAPPRRHTGELHLALYSKLCYLMLGTAQRQAVGYTTREGVRLCHLHWRYISEDTLSPSG